MIWGAPLLIIIALGLITWISTHKLDPYRPLDRLDAQPPDLRLDQAARGAGRGDGLEVAVHLSGAGHRDGQ